MKNKKNPKHAKGDLSMDLDRSLAQRIPGWELVDRDFNVGLKRPIDLVGVDEDDNLVLVLLVEGCRKDALFALEVLAFARQATERIAVHFEPRELSSGSLRVLVIATRPRASFADRLEPLTRLGLELFSSESLVSRGGVSQSLVELGKHSRAEGLIAMGFDSFLSGLSREHRDLASDLSGRIARIDEEVSCTWSHGVMSWEGTEGVLCQLEADRGRLLGRVEPQEEPLAISSHEEAELFLESILARFVENVVPAGDFEDREPLREMEIRPQQQAPLLTPEEIEAFRV